MEQIMYDFNEISAFQARCDSLRQRGVMRNLGYAGRAVPVSLWDTGDLGFVTVSVAAFVTAVTQQQEILVVALLAHLTVLEDKTEEEHPLTSRLPSLLLITPAPIPRPPPPHQLLTTFMMERSQAMDFCSCWMHMASWAALRTSVRAFLHTFIPWATSSSPLQRNTEG